MAPKSRRILMQMGLVSLVACLALVAVLVLKFDYVLEWVQGDARPLVLNGIIFALFLMGTVQLVRAIKHYENQESQISRFIKARQDGQRSTEVIHSCSSPSLLADRYNTIRDLFNSGAPVDHGAISAIMMAEESLHQSFPRFVNNVLILTGVFGTVSSLIFALVGAGDVLQASSPDAGMGLLLLGMNTALTTTATAIVCYFFFTFFFHRLTDLQTYIFSQVERAALLHIVPEFTYEPDALNRQTKNLVEDVKHLTSEMRLSLGGIENALAPLSQPPAEPESPSEDLLSALNRQNKTLETVLQRLDDLRSVLVEGFRLGR